MKEANTTKKTFLFSTAAVLLFLIIGCADSTDSGESGDTTTTTEEAPPAAPGLILTAGNTNSISMTWDPVSDATSFNLYYSTTPGVTVATGTQVANAGTYNATHNDYAYELTGLTSGVTYYLVVTAVNAFGESAESPEANATTGTPAATGPPAAPGRILTSPGATSIGMTWPNVVDATSFNLYYSTTPGVTVATGTQVVNAGTYNATYNDYAYNLTGLTTGVTYYLIVTAVNAFGESPPSPEAVETTAGTPPAAPGRILTSPGATSIVMTWPNVVDATSFNLYYSTTPGVTVATGTQVANAGTYNATFNDYAYNLTGLSTGVTYYLIVTAVNAFGESPPSPEAVETTAGTPPAAPGRILTSPGATSIVMTWPNVVDATSFNLYYSTTPGVTAATGTQVANAGTYNATFNDYAYNLTGLTTGVTYYLVVTAVNAFGESAESPEASETAL